MFIEREGRVRGQEKAVENPCALFRFRQVSGSGERWGPGVEYHFQAI